MGRGGKIRIEFGGDSGEVVGRNISEEIVKEVFSSRSHDPIEDCYKVFAPHGELYRDCGTSVMVLNMGDYLLFGADTRGVNTLFYRNYNGTKIYRYYTIEETINADFGIRRELINSKILVAGGRLVMAIYGCSAFGQSLHSRMSERMRPGPLTHFQIEQLLVDCMTEIVDQNPWMIGQEALPSGALVGWYDLSSEEPEAVLFECNSRHCTAIRVTADYKAAGSCLSDIDPFLQQYYSRANSKERSLELVETCIGMATGRAEAERRARMMDDDAIVGGKTHAVYLFGTDDLGSCVETWDCGVILPEKREQAQAQAQANG